MPRQKLEDGCELHDHCLSCPLPQCKYDLTETEQRRVMADMPVMRLLRSGMSVPEVAQQRGIHERTVYRIIARQRDAAER